ncbi:hypothetical protein F4556_007601 [Kitasatospora gansuensis]|uniref:Uncharacterized protein n=2 Tax=Kitasatospora TaxID=2063 RepID=A0A7W7SKD3_9ACTN|nr:hypothetical protein [Kitasatospora gansuensis]MBB4951947.1 hypothetical protein [Kitasatospora gansuensis]
MSASLRLLPIIGNVRPTTSNSWSATEPISARELGLLIRADWCRSVRTSDGPNSPDGHLTYYALVEIDGDVLVVTGTATGER